MKLTKSVLLGIALISLLVSCERKDNSMNEVFPETNQLVLFQVEHTNFAWGYSHSGILVDSSGNVGYFKFPKNWHSIDTAGYISESDMNINISQIDTSYLNIERNTLLKYFSLVQGAAEGEITKPTGSGADMGETIYSAFLFDTDVRKYKQVLIYQFGDWSRLNKSPEASQILEWLQLSYLDSQKKAAGQ